MSVREQLTEPWGIVASGFLGGLGWGVTGALGHPLLGLALGATIATLVFSIRVGLGVLTGSPDRGKVTSGGHSELPVPPRGSPAHLWLSRAETAVASLCRLAATPHDPVFRSQSGEVGSSATAALADLRRIAGQVTLIEQAVAGIGAHRLRREQSALGAGLAGLPSGPLRAEREKALAAVADQLEVCDRLDQVHETLLARMQSGVLGMEGLGARMAELTALQAVTGGASPVTGDRVTELRDDLEGLRAGLAEAERLSRTALGDQHIQSAESPPGRDQVGP